MNQSTISSVGLATALLVLAGSQPLLGQPWRAQVADGAGSQQVPIPAAVREACRHLPLLTADPAAHWLAFSPYHTATDTLFEVSYTVRHVVAADTLDYSATDSFTNTGQVRSSTHEISAASLPWQIRWRLRRCTAQLHRQEPTAQLQLIVAHLNPDARRLRYRARYVAYFHDPADTQSGLFWTFEFWRGSQHVKQPTFR